MATIHIYNATGLEIASLHDRKDICLRFAVALFESNKGYYWAWTN